MCLFVFEDRRAIEMERGWETSMLCVVSFSRVRWLLFTCLSFFLFFSFFFFLSFFLSCSTLSCLFSVFSQTSTCGASSEPPRW